MTTKLEFWPDYNAGPLWTPDGQEVDLAGLGLPELLRQRLVEWNRRYDDMKLPPEKKDPDWLAEGRELLHSVRSAIGDSHVVLVTEPWWGEEPDPF